MKGLENEDIENNVEVEEVEEDTPEVIETEDTVSKEEYDLLKAKFDKVTKNFKRAKSKTYKSDTTEGIDKDALKKEMREEISFYTKHPEAEKIEDSINEYRSKGLTIDEAYKLAASKEDPTLLIDDQTKAKLKSGETTMNGVANDDALGLDFSNMTSAEALKLSDDNQDKYWEYKKANG